MHKPNSTELEFPITLIFLIPAFIFSVVLFVSRWIRREHSQYRARSWPRAEAIVNSSFELNESSKNVAPEDSPAEYVHIWATAIQYSYQVNGEFFAGTYFLPWTYEDSGLATEFGKAWIGKRITIRYDPRNVERSVFLKSDGAPGKPHIPKTRADRPQVTTLSLK